MDSQVMEALREALNKRTDRPADVQSCVCRYVQLRTEDLRKYANNGHVDLTLANSTAIYKRGYQS